MKHRILVSSGGGVRGRLSIEILCMLERLYLSLPSFYDLMAGSSVGAINAAMLASGAITTFQLKDMYDDMVKKIFSRRFGIPFYDRGTFISIWDDVVGNNFLMGDCKCKLQITAVNNMTKRNHYFKSWEEKDGNEKLIDVVLRSFAAPLYFGQINDPVNRAVWFDGGVGNSNLPLDQAVTEARDILGWNKGDLLFDVVGCGFFEPELSYEVAANFNVFKQLLSFFHLSDGGLARAQSRNDQVRKLSKIAECSDNIRFRYWDSVISDKEDRLDGKEFLSSYAAYGVECSKQPLIDIGSRRIT